jgi:CDP-diacylglycerol--serine O-phosphatidyltransferase
MFTLCNALCGFTAILYTMKSGSAGDGIPITSIYLIIGAMVFDVLDGLAARVLNAQSELGIYLDSLADIISFGLAPAVIIYQVGIGILQETGFSQSLSWVTASSFLGCALWRLASFNTQAALETGDHGDFTGLPSPGGAAAVCSMALVIPQLGLGYLNSFIVYMAYSLISAVLMVSNLPYTHIRRSLTGRKKGLGVALILVLISSLLFFKIWALVVIAHLYALFPPLLALEERISGRIHRARHADI